MADMVWRPALDAPRPRAASARSCSRRSRCTRTTRRTRSSTCSARPSSATTRSGAPSSARARASAPRRADALRAFHAARYVPGDIVVAAAGSVDHDALVELVRARAGRGPAGARAPAPPAPPAPGARRARRFIAKDTEQYHVSPRRARASRATTSAASRCACSTRSSAARRPRGCSRRCARSAAWPTPSTRSRAATPHRPGRPLRRHAPGQRRHGAARSSATSSSACVQDGVTADELARAQGERARAASCWRWSRPSARMNRLGGAVLAGLPLLERRRDDRADRRRHRRRRRRARARAVRARSA